MSTINWQDLLANPEGHGFTVEDRVVHLDDKKTVEVEIPMFVPKDSELIIQKFGSDWLMTQLQGASSIRVQQQNALRNIRREDATVKRDTLLERAAKVVCKVRTAGAGGSRKVTVKVYTLPDGQEFTDLLEARQALVAQLVDMGVPASIATEKAKAAFVPAVVEDEDEDEEL